MRWCHSLIIQPMKYPLGQLSATFSDGIHQSKDVCLLDTSYQLPDIILADRAFLAIKRQFLDFTIHCPQVSTYEFSKQIHGLGTDITALLLYPFSYPGLQVLASQQGKSSYFS